MNIVIILVVVLILLININIIKSNNIVEVYHLIDNSLWGEVDGSAIQGTYHCQKHQLQCEFYSSDSKKNFIETLQYKYKKYSRKYNNTNTNTNNVVTVSLYNIHTWGLLSTYPHGPDYCKLPTDISVVESEESFTRFKKLFGDSFPHYDGNSTTHPSSIQRFYFDSSLSNVTFLTLKPFHNLIKGAVYVASTCHRNKRDELFNEIGKGFRIDSLGKCRHGSNYQRINSSIDRKPEKLLVGTSTLDNIRHKQNALNNYLFYLAFENTIEPGYVTEKIYDAFVAGTVPVYHGHRDCRKFIPHPKAAIFVDDFEDISTLTAYLNYLSHNQSAYEEHRQWRYTFNTSLQSSSQSSSSWQCNICEYAWNNRHIRHECKIK